MAWWVRGRAAAPHAPLEEAEGAEEVEEAPPGPAAPAPDKDDDAHAPDEIKAATVLQMRSKTRSA